jgi:hypothetical protein
VVESVISYGTFQGLGNIIWLKWPTLHQTRHIIWQFLKSWQYHMALSHTIDHTVADSESGLPGTLQCVTHSRTEQAVIFDYCVEAETWSFTVARYSARR